MNDLTTITNKLKAGEKLSQEQLTSLGFNSEREFIEWLNVTAEKSLATILPKFKSDRTASGGQSTVHFDKRYGFAIKAVEQHYDDMPIENTRSAFELAAQRLRSIVTPFHVHKEKGIVTYAAVKVVTPVDENLAREQGTRLVTDLFNLTEKAWKQGVFDHDIFKPGNQGILDNKLIFLDFGLSEEIHDERIYVPNQALHWDTFHIGLDKMRVMYRFLDKINPELAKYFQTELAERYGIQFNSTTLSPSCPRSSTEFEQLAKQFRKTVIEKRSNDYQPVYPLIGSPVDEAIFAELSSPRAPNSKRPN